MTNLASGSMSTSLVSLVSGSSSQKSHFKSIQTHITQVLQIPSHLTDRSCKDLKSAYAIWMKIVDTKTQIKQMILSGTWPGAVSNLISSYTGLLKILQRPSDTEIYETFVGKTTFHSIYNTVFPRATQHSDILSWLEGAPVLDATLFGPGVKPTFEALKSLLDRRDIDAAKTEKGSRKQEKGKKKANPDITETRSGKSSKKSSV